MTPSLSSYSADRVNRSHLLPRAASLVTGGDSKRLSRVPEAIAALSVFIVGSALALLRVPSITWDTLYAEDGRVFLGNWLAFASPRLIFREYAGYQHFLPRVAAWFVHLLPIDVWATSMTIAACVIVGGVAALTFRASASFLGSMAARLGLAFIPILVPIGGFEALGSVANLHWYMTFLMPWLLLAIPRRVWGAVGYAAVAAAAVLTEPQCIFYFPLVVWVGWRRPPSRAVCVAWAVGIAAQAITYLFHQVPRHGQFTDFGSAFLGYVVNASASNALYSGDLLGAYTTHWGWWFPTASLVIFVLIGIMVMLIGARTIRLAAVVTLSGSIVVWSASYFVNSHTAFLYASMPYGQIRNMPLIRWGTSAAMLLLAVVPLAAEALSRRRPSAHLLGMMMVVVMLIVMVRGFHSPDNRRGGPDWEASLPAAYAACQEHGRSVRIATFPKGWAISVPCRDLTATAGTP